MLSNDPAEAQEQVASPPHSANRLCFAAGGATCAAFSAEAACLLTGGADMAVFLHKVHDPSQASVCPLPPEPVAPPTGIDADALDEDGEPCLVSV